MTGIAENYGWTLNENPEFKEELMKLKVVFEDHNSQAGTVICALDQFEKRLSKINSLNPPSPDDIDPLINTIKMKYIYTKNGMTPCGEAALASMILAAKYIEDNCVWNLDYIISISSKIKDIRSFNNKFLREYMIAIKQIEYEHLKAVDFYIGIPSNEISYRVSQLMRYLYNDKDVLYLENEFNQLPESNISIRKGFFQYFDNKICSLPLNKKVNKSAKDDSKINIKSTLLYGAHNEKIDKKKYKTDEDIPIKPGKK